MKLPSITLSQLKIYLSVAGLIGLAVYQITQGEVQAAAASFMGALGVLGIGNQTAATRAFVDPRVETPAK